MKGKLLFVFSAGLMNPVLIDPTGLGTIHRHWQLIAYRTRLYSRGAARVWSVFAVSREGSVCLLEIFFLQAFTRYVPVYLLWGCQPDTPNCVLENHFRRKWKQSLNLLCRLKTSSDVRMFETCVLTIRGHGSILALIRFDSPRWLVVSLWPRSCGTKNLSRSFFSSSRKYFLIDVGRACHVVTFFFFFV